MFKGQALSCHRWRLVVNQLMYWFAQFSKVFQISNNLRWLASTFVLIIVALILSANMLISLIFACSHIWCRQNNHFGSKNHVNSNKFIHLWVFKSLWNIIFIISLAYWLKNASASELISSKKLPKQSLIFV